MICLHHLLEIQPVFDVSRIHLWGENDSVLAKQREHHCRDVFTRIGTHYYQSHQTCPLSPWRWRSGCYTVPPLMSLPCFCHQSHFLEKETGSVLTRLQNDEAMIHTGLSAVRSLVLHCWVPGGKPCRFSVFVLSIGKTRIIPTAWGMGCWRPSRRPSHHVLC